MTTSNLPATMNDLINALDKTTTAISQAAGDDSSYLKMTKAGEWVYGADDTEVAANSEWVVDTSSFCVGYQAWDDGELVGEETSLVTDMPIIKANLPEVGAPWKALIGCRLLCIDGKDKGVQVVYTTTSKGGIKAVNALMKDLVAHVKSNNHKGKLVPVVALVNAWYKHKQYGKIFVPVLEILDWVADVGLTDPKPEPEPEPEPKASTPRRKKAVEPEPVEDEDEDEDEDDPEPEPAPPVRRRRRA